MSIQRKLLAFGLLVITLQGAVTIGVALYTGTQTNRTARQLADDGVIRELDSTLDAIVRLLGAQHEVMLGRLDVAMQVAQDLLETSDVRVEPRRPVRWRAVDQATGAASTVSLPGLRFDGAPLLPEDAFSVPQPIVDRTTRVTNLTATLFQRMGESGDMLRVATTVQTEDRRRAVGTYIPSTNPDGTPNEVVSTLLDGTTYRGRAFVIDRWYLTTYAPWFDRSGNVVGALYVGIPQDAVRAVREAIRDLKVGKTGYAFVLGGSGPDRGRYIVSNDSSRDGEIIYDAVDANGFAFIRDMVDDSVGLEPGEHLTTTYEWKNNAELVPREKVSRTAYFPEWDWVVGVGAYREDFGDAHQALDDGLRRMLWSFLVATLLMAAVAGGGLVRFARSLARRLQAFASAFGRLSRGDLTARVDDPVPDEIGDLATKLSETVASLSAIVHRLRGSARVVEGGARSIAAGSHALNERTQAQAASLVQTTGAVATLADHVEANAERAVKTRSDATRMAKLAEAGRGVVRRAVWSMKEVARSSARVDEVVQIVDDIASRTGALASEAASEHARQGRDGAEFKAIADKVRRLARQTADAAHEIRGLLAQSLRSVDATEMQVEASDRVLAQIVTASTVVVRQVSDSAASTRDQADRIAEITRALVQMDQVTQDNSALVQRSTKSARRLSSEASDLSGIAQGFQVADDEPVGV